MFTHRRRQTARQPWWRQSKHSGARSKMGEWLLANSIGMLPTHAWPANLPQDALQTSGLPHLKLPPGEPAQMAHLRGLALRTALKPARPRMRPFNIHLLERMLSHPGLHGEFISVRGLENRASFGRYYSNRCCSPRFYLFFAHFIRLPHALVCWWQGIEGYLPCFFPPQQARCLALSYSGCSLFRCCNSVTGSSYNLQIIGGA